MPADRPRPMTDDRSSPPATIAVGFQSLIEGLRDDVREDIKDLRVEMRDGFSDVRRDMTAQIDVVARQGQDTRALVESFATTHAAQHVSERRESEATHTFFKEWIDKFEVDQARRDGALGVLRFVIELVSRNAAAIVTVLVAIATFLGFVTGNIHLALGEPK